MSVACLEERTLVEFLAGTLLSKRVAGVEAHLDGCSACRQIVASLGRSEVGEQIDRYRVLERLGSGATGTVYAAFDSKLERNVALKLLHPLDGEQLSLQRSRLEREAHALAKLTHPNVITVYDVGVHGEQAFLTMPLIDGTTASKWQPSSWRDVTRVMRDAAQGLGAIHLAGLLHRDVKPDNILVDKNGHGWIADLGLAEAIAGARGHETLAGTPRYMSPEQLRGEKVDARADIFGFCATFYRTLYGEAPFVGVSVEALLNDIAKHVPTPTSPRGPRSLLRLLQRGLRADAAERFQSMHELERALQRVLSPRGKRIALASAAVAIVFGVTFSWQTRCAAREKDVPSLAQLSSVLSATGAQRERILQRVGAYAKELGSATRAACEQRSSIFDRLPADVADLREACLHERRSALASFVNTVGADVVASKVETGVDRMPAISDCEPGDELRRRLPLPTDTNERRRVIDMLAELRAADMRAQLLVTNNAGALPPWRSVDFPEVHARGLFLEGMARLNTDAHAASALLQQGSLAAERARDDELRFHITQARAAAELNENEMAAADADIASADAIADRLGAPPKMRAQSERLKAMRGMLAGDLEGALEHAQHAHEAILQIPSLTPSAEMPIVAQVCDAAMLAHAFDIAEPACRAARTLIEHVVGTKHRMMLNVRSAEGEILRARGRYDEALVAADETIGMAKSILAPGDPSALGFRQMRASVLASRGLVAQAEAEYRDVLRLMETQFGSSYWGLVPALLSLGELAAKACRHEEALAIGKRVERFSPAPGTDDFAHWHALVGLAMGDAPGARKHLTMAREIWERHPERNREELATLAPCARPCACRR